MYYQKDGPGPLLRCYWDRIHYPKALGPKLCALSNLSLAPVLLCSFCRVVIGTPMIYEKEHRFAYHMRLGFFSAKKIAVTKCIPF